MKRFYLVLLVVLLGVCFVGCGDSSTADDDEETEERTTLVVGMEVNYAPFNYEVTEETETSVAIDGGYADGYDVMIAQDIADQLGLELVIKKYSWDGLLPALDAGDIDCVIAGMTATDEREEGADFTTPYYDSNGMIMIVRADSEMANFTSIQDFSGYTVVGQLNTSYDEVIDQIEGVIHATAKATYPEMVLALQQGDVDGITAEYAVAVGIIEANPDLTYITFDEGEGFEADTTVSIALAEGTRDTEFFQQVQAALDNISEETRQAYMVQAVENQPANEE